MVDKTRRNVLLGIGTGTTVATLGGFGIAGAQEEPEDDDEDDMDTEDDENSRIRVAHLSPDMPSVDIYINGIPALEDVSFRAVSDYLELEPDTYNLQVVPAGEDVDEAIVDGDLTLEEGDYTAAAIGELTDLNQSFVLRLYEDQNELPDEEIARLRVFHTSPDAPAVDVVPSGTDEALIENLEFGEGQYVEVPADSSRLCIYPAGERDEAIFGTDVDLEGETVYSAFALGYIEPEDAPVDEPFDVLLVVDAEEEDEEELPEEDEEDEEDEEELPEEDEEDEEDEGMTFINEEEEEGEP